MITTIENIQDEIVSEFLVFDDWMDKYNYLIDLAKELPIIDPKYKKEEYAIQGCQSKVWLNAEYTNGKIIYTADSNAIITKGIISLLIRVLSNRSPKEIMDADLSFIEKIGLKENLSPTRANGLVAMIKQMKLFAIAYDAREQKN
jgi:cysteine desulfuration protein SufE